MAIKSDPIMTAAVSTIQRNSRIKTAEKARGNTRTQTLEPYDWSTPIIPNLIGRNVD